MRTEFFGLEQIARGYLALKYSCGIVKEDESRRFPGFKRWTADGSTVITYKDTNSNRRYLVHALGSVEFEESKEMTLDEIKAFLIDDLHRYSCKCRQIPCVR